LESWVLLNLFWVIVLLGLLVAILLDHHGILVNLGYLLGADVQLLACLDLMMLDLVDLLLDDTCIKCG
jgi:hypothetical protein